MADGTKIEWTDATWNVINGCSVTSPGCPNCYAMRLAGTRLRDHPSRMGLTRESKAGPVWTGETRFNEKVLLDPLRWRRPRRIFVCAHGDLFHENVPDEWIDRVFAVMALAPQHQFQVLTKRAERMRSYVCRWYGRRFIDGPRNAEVMLGVTDAMLMAARLNVDEMIKTGLPIQKNIWLGVSVEDQTRADERIPHLLATPAAIRWLSCEPLLGELDLTKIQARGGNYKFNSFKGQGHTGARVNWVVAGGESGPGARPMHPDWARSLRDQCAAAGVPFLFKQWGTWAPVGRLSDPFGDTDETVAAEDAMMEAMITLRDGRLWIDPARLQLVDRNMFNWANEEAQPPGEALVIRHMAKSRAGRLLDGVEHNGYPA